MSRSRLLTRAPWLLVLVALVVSGTALASDYGSKSEIPDEPCFGAAARDPQNPCRNKKLRLKVVPKPSQAVLELNSPCTLKKEGKELYACHFGVEADQATASVALIGDSHAADKRAAFQTLVDAKSWQAVSITQTGCPYTASRTKLDGHLNKQCADWKPEVTRYLKKHPEVETIFVSSHAGARVITPKGRTEWGEKVGGYVRLWKRLPDSVKHVVVLRDAPRATVNSMDCVSRAIKRKKPAGPACAIPRDWAAPADPAIAAAEKMKGKGVEIVDLTDYMCSPRLCFQVVGGALVHKDTGHLTQVFATTLGPYVQRAVEQLMTGWEPLTKPGATPAGGASGDAPPSGGGGAGAPPG
jgi:hypothetical protein